ncbi:MAG TPA: hypothetical protein VMS65_18105 [Polyangiaceae bacterium]|nr:hypothetical protein [Polyangiaceae bacterium]
MRALLCLVLAGCAAKPASASSVAPVLAPPAAPKPSASEVLDSPAPPAPAPPSIPSDAGSANPDDTSRLRTGAVWPPPGEGWTPPPCQLEASTVVHRRGSVFEVTARLKNVTSELLVVEMPDRCPQGPAIFSGLPEGYDYYRSCTKGACGGQRVPIRHSIAAGQSLEIEAIEIDPAGASCNRPLAPTDYSLGFSFQTPLRVCGGVNAKLSVRAPAQTKQAKTPPEPLRIPPSEPTR